MATARRLSEKKRCDTCHRPRSVVDYPSSGASTCTECLNLPGALARAAQNLHDASTTSPVSSVRPPRQPRQPKLLVRPKDTLSTGIHASNDEPRPIEIAADEAPFIANDVEIDYENPTTRELAARTLARRSLMQFIKRFRPKYLDGWVHHDICRRLERFLIAVENQESPRMLLCMPVRMGKSEIGSRHYAPWLLGKHPDWEIIAASGGQGLAITFSRYIRDLVRDPSYKALFPEMALDSSSQSVENWNTSKGGGYMAAGIGTMIVGRGAHILLIDDPCTSAEAADSQVQRDSVWEWYIANALNRLAPGGGVLGILCMTGDTPVLMATGVEQRLDTLAVGNTVATFENGRLSVAKVLGLKSNGRDSILRIKTSSGKIVRSNGRHPFLATINGELKWIRARSLTTANRIVIVKGSGESGKALSAQQMGATYPSYVEGTVSHTTPRNDGPMDTVAQQMVLNRDEMQSSSTCTESLLPNTTDCSPFKKDYVLSAGNHRVTQGTSEVERSFVSIIVTPQVEYEGCSASVAIQESEYLKLSPWHVPQCSISDFTLDEIVSIESDGVEEVFDVQIERTENFIANGVVSHNTHWNEDDWAGRVQQLSKMTDGGDKFEIVKYPAINDQGDEYILADDSIEQFPPGSDIPAGARLTRVMNTPLHPDRYTLKMLLNTKATYYALGQQRWWAALYQQNPAPDDGVYFTKKMFRFYAHEPHVLQRRTYQAWDFAITEKQQSDYTVGTTGYQDQSNALYVADIVRFKSEDSFVIIDAILDNWVKHGSCALLGFEDGQIWKALSAVFERRCRERNLYPSYELLVPLTDKGVRAQPLKGLMQGGKVWFKEGATWWDETGKELTQFLSGGKHDDIVDSLSWLARLSLKHIARKAPDTQKPLKSWKDKLKAMLNGKGASHMAA